MCSSARETIPAVPCPVLYNEELRSQCWQLEVKGWDGKCFSRVLSSSVRAALTLVCWKEAAGLLPCLNSKGALPPLLGLAAKGRRLQCSLLQMDAMLRGEKLTVYLTGLRNAPLGQQMGVLEITALRGGSTWVQARSQAQSGTAVHALTCGTAVERASPPGPRQRWCCTSLEQCLCVCDQSPMVFGPEWEVKLQEKCWLLFLQKSSGSTGSGSTCWHAAFWAAVLFILESREVSPWKQQCCSIHKVIPEIHSSEKTILEVWREAWWPQPLQGRKGCQWRGHTGKWWLRGFYSDHWDPNWAGWRASCGRLGVWTSFPIRTSWGASQRLQSSGLFVLQEVSELAGPTWVLKGGVVVLEAVSSLFSVITCTSPHVWVVGGHRKGWMMWLTHHPSSSVSSGPAVFSSNNNSIAEHNSCLGLHWEQETKALKVSACTSQDAGDRQGHGSLYRDKKSWYDGGF